MLAEKRNKLEQEFMDCQKTLIAIGDEVRQHLLLLMLKECAGDTRVADLAERTNLTRSAVSHHMQILKEAGIVKCRKSGKFIYYSFDPTCGNINMLLTLFENVKKAIQGEV